MQNEMMQMVESYTWPSQAFWRYFELQVLRSLKFQRPILEIGCGDGEFSSLIFDEIDEAIDVNPRSVEKARSAPSSIYRAVRCEDARELSPMKAGYGTVYANCVMEHIPEIGKVLEACFRSLRDGGALVITVPLSEMNSHLVLPWTWYANLRRRQLQHINLLSREQWQSLLQSLGFRDIRFIPYLSAASCKFWDSMDTFACIGSGRYTLSSGTRILARKLLPKSVKQTVKKNISKWLRNNIALNERASDPCATAIVAIK
jgi:SAM-dependent methyltransferase